MKRTRKHGGARDGDYRLLVDYNSMPEGVKEAIRDNAKWGCPALTDRVDDSVRLPAVARCVGRLLRIRRG
jgi:hypothetical protein